MPEFPRGRFAWHELLTTDTAAAQRFYKEVVGWGTRSWEQNSSYTLWTRKGEPAGGLMVLPEDAKQMGAPPNWLFYGAVPDVHATVRQANGLGGKVLAEAQEIPTVGWFAVLQDPQGAVFAVLQPGGEVPGHDGVPKQGEFSWHELATTDPNAAWRFYQALFGWEKTESMDMGPGGVYQMYGRKGRSLGGIYRKPPEMPAPPHWLCYVKVPSADAAAKAVERLGGKVLNGPMEVPGGSGDRVAQCMDPQGAAFAVHSVAVVEAARFEPTRTKPPQAAVTQARKAAKKAVKKAKRRVKKAVGKAKTKIKKTAKRARKAAKKAAKKAKKAVKRVRRKKKR